MSREIEIYATGDVFLNTKDNTNPFSQTAGYFQGEVSLINLETVIANSCKDLNATPKSVSLCQTPDMLENLELCKLNIVNIANNHIHDYGQKELRETIKNLTNWGISIFGKSVNTANFKTHQVENLQISFSGIYLNK